LKYQKFLGRIGPSAQLPFQLIQVNLLGAASLEKLLNPDDEKKKIPMASAC
jgi:hypothetical protein